MGKLTLYQLTDLYLELAEKLADADFDPITISDTIESSGLVDDFIDKAQALEFVARSAIAHNAAIDAEIIRLKSLKTKRESTALGIRKYIFDSMIRIGVSKVTCPLFQLSIANNPGAVDVFEPGLLPSVYMREVPAYEEPDKALISKALKEGFDVPGARLVQSQRLSVK